MSPSRNRSARAAAALLSALSLVFGVGATGSAAAAPAGSRALFTFADPRIDEASGIARGIRSPGVFYVQNDSGDSARFFAVDAGTGRTLAVYSVPGASNVDWEDLAVATDSRGVPSVWIADIGDNDAGRAEIRIYRVDEPKVDPAGTGATIATTAPQVWRLKYPDGPQDAEALAVAPGGAMFLFDKVVLGETEAYSVPARPDPSQIRVVTRIGAFNTVDTGTTGGPNVFGRLTVTGAALNARGDILAVRTYTDAYLWRIGPGSVTEALSRSPVHIPLPAQPQGEGITVDGTRLVTDSEKVGSTVWSVPLPALPALPATESSAAPTGAASGSGSSTTGAGGTSATAGGSSPSAARADRSRSASHTSDWIVIGLAAIVVIGAGGLLARRLRRR